MIIIWTNLVDLASPMLYTKILPQSFLGSGEEGFEVFLPYTSAKPFDQIVRRSHVKSVENWHAVSEKKTIKDW